jgi:hypothetical protein
MDSGGGERSWNRARGCDKLVFPLSEEKELFSEKRELSSEERELGERGMLCRNSTSSLHEWLMHGFVVMHSSCSLSNFDRDLSLCHTRRSAGRTLTAVGELPSVVQRRHRLLYPNILQRVAKRTFVHLVIGPCGRVLCHRETHLVIGPCGSSHRSLWPGSMS